MTDISWADFERVDIRVGRILAAKPNARAIKPAYHLTVDLVEKAKVYREQMIEAVSEFDDGLFPHPSTSLGAEDGLF